MKISYYDDKCVQHIIEIPHNVIAVHLPETEDLPELTVTVNADAFILDKGNCQVCLHEFTELLEESC